MGDERQTDGTAEDTEGHGAKWRGAPEEAQDASGHAAKFKGVAPAGVEDDGDGTDDVEGHKRHFRS